MKIVEISTVPDLLNAAITYFHQKWGSDSNYIFYKDCIEHSVGDSSALPKFFVVLEKDAIIASYALLTNDIISRQDLMPWFACLFVNEEYRNQGIAGKLLEHALKEAHAIGFSNLYLSTDLVGFYEKKGWEHVCMGYGVSGDAFKVYAKETVRDKL